MVNDVDPSYENYQMPTYEEVFNQRKKPIRRKMTEGQKRSGRNIRFNNVIQSRQLIWSHVSNFWRVILWLWSYTYLPTYCSTNMLNKYFITLLVVITIIISANGTFFPSGDDILVYNVTRGKQYLSLKIKGPIIYLFDGRSPSRHKQSFFI